jgi:hypothetical protein
MSFSDIELTNLNGTFLEGMGNSQLIYLIQYAKIEWNIVLPKYIPHNGGLQ